MKKNAIVFVICLSLIFSPLGETIPGVTTKAEAKTYVYYVINTSYAYHQSKGCRTLSRSNSNNIKRVTRKKAKNILNLSPCKVCNPR